MTTRFLAASHWAALWLPDFRAAAVFDRFGLDFCGGKRTLSEACEQRGMVVEQVETAPRRTRHRGTVDVPNESWAADELTRYIERRHHTFVREQTLVIDARLDKLEGPRTRIRNWSRPPNTSATSPRNCSCT